MTIAKRGAEKLGEIMKRIEVPAARVAPAQMDPEEQKRIDLEQRLEHLALTVPPKYSWASFGSPLLAGRMAEPKLVATARAAVAGPTLPSSIVLLGAAGSGKTSLACAILRFLVEEKGLHGRFASAFSLAKARQEIPLGEGEAKPVQKAMLSKLLLLDELGGELSRNTAVQELVHERHANELVTIYTTGLSQSELLDKYGEGIVRRVVEGAVVISLGGRRRT